jgi:hypothetical protein
MKWNVEGKSFGTDLISSQLNTFSRKVLMVLVLFLVGIGWILVTNEEWSLQEDLFRASWQQNNQMLYRESDPAHMYKYMYSKSWFSEWD